MGIKQAPPVRLIALLFLFLTLPIFAQQQQIEEASIQEDPMKGKDYYTRATAEGIIQVVQKISWPAAEYVRFYEVILEKQDDSGAYEAVGTYKTETNELEVTLKSGQYRYRIILYNLLGKPAFETPFTKFSVNKAYIPAAADISPAVIYLDDIYDGQFTVRGANLLPQTEFTLIKENRHIAASSADTAQNGRSAGVTFPTALFDTGIWKLRAQNPGGFTAEIPFQIRFFKWYDVNAAGGYQPLFVVYDKTIADYFGTNMSLLGASARINFIPYKRRFGYFGAGLHFSYHRLQNISAEYNLHTNLFQMYALFVYQLPLIKNRLVLDIHGGPGLLAVQGLKFSFPHNLHSDPFTSLYVSMTAGVSLRVFIYKRLYIEAGADYMVSFIPDISFMAVTPTLSMGWLF